MRQAVREGIDRFVVFGAGIPAIGSVHESAPGARVLYTDADPRIVEVGRQIVARLDDVDYEPADATSFHPAADEPVGLVFLGLAAFLGDATPATALRDLHDAVPAGSRLLFDFDSTELAAHPEALAMMGPAFHMREPATFAGLLGPWTPTAEGIVPVARRRPGRMIADVPDAFWGGVAVKG